ncbi:helix-turn-helix transcriptional regulator [Saccharopolyspora sp. 5N708]|uniref:helix-turn-helix transcriptional regulator n=1 Tax=Saccharopolyspora sp. 5N708 TaxID=3457424 RepID=UPI003FCFFC00
MPTDQPILGRDTEIAALRDRIRTAASGSGRAVLVFGEPGIGKSTLLARAADECARAGFQVSQGGTEAMEERIPFAALTGWLGIDRAAEGAELAQVAELLSAGERGRVLGAARWEYVVTESVVDLVEKLAARQPVALLLDDLHWADIASLVVVNRISRLLSQLPVLLVCAYRPVPVGAELATVIHGLETGGALSLRLGPLSPEAAAELTESLLAAPAPDALLDLVDGAAGNPFYIKELVASLREPGGWNTAVAPKTFAAAVHLKLDYLPQPSREVLGLMAVLGGRMTISELSAVVGRSPLVLWRQVRDAVDNGLLVEDGDRLAFQHDLIRQAMVATVPATMRQPMLLEAGRALAGTGAPVRRVAEFLLAGNELDNDTIDWLIESAITLILQSPDTAIELLTRSLAQHDPAEPRCDVLRFLHVIALQWVGRGAEAEQAARAALARNRDPDLIVQLRWSISRACLLQGDADGAVAATEDILSAGQLDGTVAGQAHSTLAQFNFIRGNREAWTRHAEEAVRLGEEVGSAHFVACGLVMLGAAKLVEGDPASAFELATRGRATWGDQDYGPEEDELAAPLLQANSLLELDRLAEAEQCLRDGIRVSEAFGSSALTWYSLVAARVGFEQGRWDDALAEIQAGYQLNDPFGQHAALRLQEALIRIHRDEPTDSLPSSAPGRAAQNYEYLRRWARALDVERSGDDEGALVEHLAHLRAATSDWGQDMLVHHTWVDLARVAVITGRPEVLDELVPAARGWHQRCPTPVKRGLASLLHGAATADPPAVTAAAQDFADGGRPLLSGMAWEIVARLTPTSDAWCAAATKAAITAYESFDARWDLRRIDTWARSRGLRRPRRSNRPKSGWAALTPTEVRIALLTAEGLSNPDIANRLTVSRRTVQSHISSILAKLGCHSRVELAVIAIRHRR